MGFQENLLWKIPKKIMERLERAQLDQLAPNFGYYLMSYKDDLIISVFNLITQSEIHWLSKNIFICNLGTNKNDFCADVKLFKLIDVVYFFIFWLFSYIKYCQMFLYPIIKNE
jgi:hypothetical protein